MMAIVVNLHGGFFEFIALIQVILAHNNLTGQLLFFLSWKNDLLCISGWVLGMSHKFLPDCIVPGWNYPLSPTYRVSWGNPKDSVWEDWGKILGKSYTTLDPKQNPYHQQGDSNRTVT